MSTERKPVDVLAVMDAHAASCESAAIRNSSEDNIAAHNAACEARAAVAELIAASKLVMTKPDMATVRGRQEMSRRLRALSAALARVGGAA